jgi:hypothetical protein
LLLIEKLLAKRMLDGTGPRPSAAVTALGVNCRVNRGYPKGQRAISSDRHAFALHSSTIAGFSQAANQLSTDD